MIGEILMKKRKTETVFNAHLPKTSMKMYIRFWRYIVNKQILSFIGYAILLIVISSLTPIFTLVWNNYIDSVMSQQKVFFSLMLLLSYIAIRILIDFGFFFSMRYMDHINFASWRLLDGDINQKAISIKYEFFEIPELQTRINRAWNFSHGSYIEIYQLGLEILRGASQIIGIIVSLIIIDYRISFIALLAIIPALIGTIYVDKNQLEYDNYLSKERLESDYYKSAKYNQNLIKDIICYNAFDFFNHKFINKTDEIYVESLRFEKKKLKYMFAEEIIRNIVIILCIAFTAFQVIEERITLGGLSVTLSLIINLVYSIQRITKNITTIYTHTADIAQFYEFMDMEEDTNNTQEEVKKEQTFNIILNDVSYAYPFTDNEVLKGINLNIKSGSHIAVVGDNGSGKTTLIKLIMGLIEPTKGNVVYEAENGDNISSATNLFTVVFQDFCKYKESLKYNIMISDFYKENLDSEVNVSLKKVGLKKHINSNTVLSKEFGGIELSGGEWQKIATARAIFKESAVLVLDEPTAAIDPLEETKLYKLYNELSIGKTSIFVTHRLGSVLFSDLVLYLEDGRIVEMGSHAELLKCNGKYAKYWYTQAGQYAEDI